MATGTLAPRARRRGSKGLWRVAVIPGAVGLVAIAIGASLGHVEIGLLLAVGVALGTVNGLLLEQATAKIVPTEDPDRRAVVKGSLGRLGLVSAIALVIAFLARPNGWVLLLGLAGYQILALLSQLGAAMKEARLG
ncbi:MAG TPA: hypothetical protein VMZ11_02235 [Mycobacteriales bacterium]|nr:hypothetical protein [Mycobacteriales bacterium]